jgi:hypothetical protein
MAIQTIQQFTPELQQADLPEVYTIANGIEVATVIQCYRLYIQPDEGFLLNP